jgi:hypothetical protein
VFNKIIIINKKNVLSLYCKGLIANSLVANEKRKLIRREKKNVRSPFTLPRFQCRNFQVNGYCPAGDLYFFYHGYQPPDEGLYRLLTYIRTKHP